MHRTSDNEIELNGREALERVAKLWGKGDVSLQALFNEDLDNAEKELGFVLPPAPEAQQSAPIPLSPPDSQNVGRTGKPRKAL